MTSSAPTAILAGALLVSACTSTPNDGATTEVAIEETSIASASARIAVGRRLFFDKRLSWNGRQSCGTCHIPNRAFADGLNRAVGSEGDLHFRNTPALVNLDSYESFTWLAPGLSDLAEQAKRPLLGTTPIVELGMGGHETELLDRLRADEDYRANLPIAFPEREDPFVMPSVLSALAAFERTIVARDAPYDRYLRGDRTAMTESGLRGAALFSGRLGCAACHGGLDLHEPTAEAAAHGAAGGFANNGLYATYPASDPGLRALTQRAEDEGRFRIPSLRNVAVTKPYMHDGSVETLDDVLTSYARGGRYLASGPYAGDGALHPYKHPAVKGFSLSDAERDDVIAFLESLTDLSFTTRPELGDPFPP